MPEQVATSASPKPRQGFERVLRRTAKPWEEIVLVIGIAAIVSVLLDALVQPPATWLEFARRIVGSGTRLLFAVLLGMWLGTRTWPKRGRALGARLLRRSAASKVRPLLVLTARPDFPSSMPRRIFEVVGFVAGTTIVIAAGLVYLGLGVVGVVLPSNLYVLGALWGAFVLVPYWSFARLGLRRVDPVRWTVEPLSRRYANRLRLSNGALMLIAFGLLVNLFFRAGQTGNEALLAALRLLGHLVAVVLVVAAAAVAYYARHEKRVAMELEAAALAAGVKDGRDLSDGDFLPRVR